MYIELSFIDLCHADVLDRVQVEKMKWPYIICIAVPSPTLSDEFSSLEGLTHKSVSMKVSRGQRFTETEGHTHCFLK